MTTATGMSRLTAHRTSTSSATRSPRPALPPMGPPWWGAVMGTGLLANLTFLHAGGTTAGAILAEVLLAVAWALLVLFTVSYLTRVVRSVDAWRGTVHGPGASAWGMVAMGLMSVGSATHAIIPGQAALVTDAVLWSIGTIVGVATTFAFTFGIMATRFVEPRPAWGLAVVPLMVTATTGSAFIPSLGSGAAFAMLTLLVGCFVASLSLAGMIFTAALHYHARHDRIPVQAAVSSFIPLGPVGQSAAAAHTIAAQSAGFLMAGVAPFAAAFAHVYAIIMSIVAVPLIIFAVVTTLRGLAQGMRFSPGWWAMTFPVGTLSLGAYYLGAAVPGYAVVSTIVWVCLLGTWSVCAVGSARAWWFSRQPA